MNIRQTAIPRRVPSLALCAAMVLTLLPLPTPAEGICGHHPEHTADCGYKAAVEGKDCAHSHNSLCGYQEASPCSHSHDESCGYREASACAHRHTEECGGNGESCTHSHDEGCGYQEAENCTHSHDESCGYREARDCTHAHDDTCGYVEAVTGSPCTYRCEICAQQASQQQNGQDLCTHGNESAACETCASEKKVTEVQTLINALPETVTVETGEAAQSALSAVEEAKAALTEAEQEKLDLTRYTALKALLAEPEAFDTGKVLTDWEWDYDELIDDETGVLALPFTGEEFARYLDVEEYYNEILKLLPGAILVDGEMLPLEPWTYVSGEAGATVIIDSVSYPSPGIFQTTLPEGYVLADGTKVLSLTVALEDLEGEPVGVYAGSTSTHSHCVCGATHSDIGDHTSPEEITWQPLDSEPARSVTLSNGNYYLTKDLYFENSTSFAIIAGHTVNLCLNGHKIYGSRYGILVPENAVLRITDCQGTGQIVRNRRLTNADYLGAIYIYANGKCSLFSATVSDFYHVITNCGEFRLYSGKISGNSEYATYGGGIENRSGGTVFMYGGTISGCRIDKTASGGSGVYNDGTFYMSGGTITDCEITGSGSGAYTASGSGFYNTSTGTFVMTGGSITGNSTGNTTSTNAGFGYGVYNCGTMQIGGSAQIYGNTRCDASGKSESANLLLNDDNVPTVTTAFTDGARIVVVREDGYGKVANVDSGVTVDLNAFQPQDADNYKMGLTIDGEPALVGKGISISLDKDSIFLSSSNNYSETVTIQGLPEGYDTSKIRWRINYPSNIKDIHIQSSGLSCRVYIEGQRPCTATVRAIVEGHYASCNATCGIVLDWSHITYTNTSLTYDGNEKTIGLSHAENIEWTGVRSATIPGQYTIEITPKDNCCWDDGTQETKQLHWEIKKGTYSGQLEAIGKGTENDPLSTVGLPDGWEWVEPDKIFPNTTSNADAYMARHTLGYYNDKAVTVYYNQRTGLSAAKNDKWRTKYYVDECLDLSGLTVTATYADGTTRKITNYTVSQINGIGYYQEVRTQPLSNVMGSVGGSSINRLTIHYTGHNNQTDVYDLGVTVYTKIVEPSLELPYNGQAQTPFKNATTLKPYSDYCVNHTGGDYWATEPGTYSVTLKPTTWKSYTYAWSEGYNRDEKTFQWKIVKSIGAVTFPDSIDRTYTGQPVSLSQGTDYTVTGNGAVTLKYKVKDAADGTYTTTAPTAIGEYTVQVNLAESDHYSAATATKDFEIKGIPVTISGEIQTNPKVYDGTNAATFNCEGVTIQGVAEGADVQLNAEGYFKNVNAGDSVSAVLTSLSLTGVDAGMYVLQVDPLPTPAPAAITAKPLSDSDINVTLTGNTPVYDGNEKTQSVAVTYGEITLEEGKDYTLSGNAGTGAGTYTLKVELKGNYSGSKEQGWEIAKASITPVVSLGDTVYGDPLSPSVSGNPGKGEVTYTYYSDAACTDAVTPNNVGTYYVRATVAETPNYQSGTSEPVPFRITPRPVTVSGITAEDKTYDGNTTATLNYAGVTFTGKLEGDSLTVEATGEFESVNAAENKTVTITNLTLGGASKDNYVLAADGQQATATAAITKANASVTKAPEDAKSLYSGVDVPLVTAGTAQGGTMMYRLGENSQWSEELPQAAAHGEYTVYYYVKGDGNHEDTAQQSLQARIRPFRIHLQPQPPIDEIKYGTSIKRSVGLETKVTEGISYQWCLVTVEDGKEIYTPLEGKTGSELTLTKPNAGKYVYACVITCGDYSETSSKATVTVTAVSQGLPTTDLPDGLWVEGGEKPLVDNSIDLKSPSSFLMTSYTYNGASADAHQNYPTGMQIYSVQKDDQGNTAVAPVAELGSQPLTLSTGKSSYAYKRGVSDPVFANVGALTQYTNVLVWDSLEAGKYAEDIVMRPYIKLINKEGQTVVLYGGTVSRSIGYVAQQNANTFSKGTAGYKYVHEIIDKVNALHSSTGTNTTTGGNG